MARSPEVPFSDEAVPGDERWPVLYTALFVAVASAGLWALIIGAIRWLMF